jgi:MraZ protein
LVNLFALVDEELGIISLLPPVEMSRAGHNIHTIPGISPQEIREFRRFMFARSVDCPLDSQGRILLPAEQLQEIGLGKDDRDVVLAGVGDRIELWPARAWAAAEAAQKAKFNQLRKGLGF